MSPKGIRTEERLFADLVYSLEKDYETALIMLCGISHDYPHLDLNEMLYCLEMAIKHDKEGKRKEPLQRKCNGSRK